MFDVKQLKTKIIAFLLMNCIFLVVVGLITLYGLAKSTLLETTIIGLKIAGMFFAGAICSSVFALVQIHTMKVNA